MVTFNYHHQNLTEGQWPLWRHGRAWLGRLHWEWSLFMWPRFGFSFRKGDYFNDGNKIAISMQLLIATLHVSYEFDRWFKHRELSLEVHHGSIWLRLWTPDTDWHRDRPWWENVVCISVQDWIVGKGVHHLQTGERREILIPMPEGCYRAIATFETRTWTYRFGYKITQEGWNVDIPGGIPFQGKGENSWDCGDDGLFSYGSSGHSIEKAIAVGVEKCLEYRRKRGNVSKIRNLPIKIINDKEKVNDASL